jgi:hypothetical protein
MKPLLAVGAAAGAIATILGLGTTVAGWLQGDPGGLVSRLGLQSVKLLTYGEWRSHENIPLTGVPTSQLRTPGRLINYEVDTQGFNDGTRLPVRIIVHNVTLHMSATIDADAIVVTAGDDCTCFDWVAVPSGDAEYFVEVAVFGPGPIRAGQQPLKAVATEYFKGST